MSNLIYRLTKGSPLTNEEVDGNFRHLEEKVENLGDVADLNTTNEEGKFLSARGEWEYIPKYSLATEQEDGLMSSQDKIRVENLGDVANINTTNEEDKFLSASGEWEYFDDSEIQTELSNKVDKANNLSDLPNKTTARSNLGLGTSATLNKTDVLGTSTSLVATQKLVNDTKIDLESSIDTKANIHNPTFTGTVSGVTKSMVGLGSVNNTSDINKPISNATQTALDKKVDKETGKSLISTADIQKLSGIEAGAQVNLISVDNLTSDSKTRPLSANQGKILKGLIDGINTILQSDDSTLDELQEIVDFIKLNREDLDSLGISSIAGLEDALAGKQPLNSILTGTTASFTSALKTKLDGIATGATKNATDAQLRARSSHTGTQAISTVEGLDTALDGKVDTTDTRLTNSREWTASVVSQSEAEAGTATTARKWTAQRVAQAISAQGLKIGTTSSTAKAGNWVPTWANVTGKPTTFTPSAHTHSLSEVTDAGNLAALSTNASTSNFLRGDGTWVTPPNTTYTEISTAEIDAGTASTLRTISGRRMKYALDKKSDTGHGHVIGDVTGLQAAIDSKANTSTQVIAGTGLSGGGTLAANRTLSVNYGTAAGTAAQGNDSRIVNAVQTSRSISTGTGLSGGGNLSANRTLSVASTYSPNTSQSLSSQNLDDLKTPGFYHQTANANATTERNYPEERAGTLVVTHAAGVVQEYTCYHSGNKYYRGFYSNSWGAWRTVYHSGSSIPWARISGAPSSFSRGMIMMWSGSTSNIPSGWALCNGSNGTPDLRGRFVIGAGGDYDVGSTGGGSIPSHSHGAGTLAAASAGAHTHTGTAASAGGHSHTASSGSAGAHSHSGTASSAGAHTHALDVKDHSDSGSNRSYTNRGRVGSAGWLSTGSAGAHTHSLSINSGGGHSHTVSVASGGAHTHSVSVTSAGAHTHTISGSTAAAGSGSEVIAKYYALCYIMKL